jgi:sulfoxide reductase catalytic subunit YedY
VAQPVELSLDQLRALGTASHVSQHNCIQGWSGVAEWTGVPVAALLDHVRPLPQARWAVFYSYGPGVAGGPYYDAHPLDQLRAPHCLLAWAMNGEPLPLTHGAPLRLRNENELGYKQVKWIERIEFISDYRTVGAGHGGYNEDHKFYGVSASI